MFFTLDRIEGGWAVFDCPLGDIRLPLESIYSGAKEGDVCILEHGRFSFCPDETGKVRSRVEALSNSLFIE